MADRDPGTESGWYNRSMTDEAKPSGWLPRSLVILTALLCVLVGGYASHVWWVRRLVRELLQGLLASRTLDDFFNRWKECPWYGLRGRGPDPWIPRRTFRELLVAATGQGLGDDPETWKGWFRQHPVLVWDKRLGHLVDKPGNPGESTCRYDAQDRVACPIILQEAGP